MKKLLVLIIVLTAWISGNLGIIIAIIFGIGIPFILLMGIAEIVAGIIGKHKEFIAFANKLKKYGFEYGGNRRYRIDDTTASYRDYVVLPNYDSHHTTYSNDDWDRNDGLYLNPSSGLPVRNGIDSAGNSFGSIKHD